MIKFVVFLLILTIVPPSFADIITSTGNGPNYRSFMNKTTTVAPLHSPYRSQRYHRNTHCPTCHNHTSYLSRNNLNALEKYALNKTFNRESELQRLERLEDLAFGSIQEGDLVSRYKNIENAILSRPKTTAKSSVLNNLANYFSGQTTGFTPSLIPYPSYNNLGGFSTTPYGYGPNYNSQRIEQFSNGIFGGGYGFSGSNFGNGSSIRILD